MTKKDSPISSAPTVPETSAIHLCPERRKRATIILERLIRRYPDMRTHLHAENPWQLLVATVLAAQCTDARVNTITPDLFRRWPDPAALAAEKTEEVEAAIRSTGFYRNKAKNLISAARILVRDFGGQVPHTMKELISLPGVARKTANCVLWGGFGVNEGIAVDTHVKRISFRLGLTAETRPEAVERDLMEIFPRAEWGGVNHRMVQFGREVCTARKPLCQECDLGDICPRCGI